MVLSSLGKFTVNARAMTINYQNRLFWCIVRTFECHMQHLNVVTLEGLVECRTFVYALNKYWRISHAYTHIYTYARILLVNFILAILYKSRQFLKFTSNQYFVLFIAWQHSGAT